jgi:hypothetical protein
VFPGLGDAAPAETEFVSDELDPEALREVRTTARRMERQRERLESMQIGADEQPPAEAEEMPKASETAQKAPDTAPDAAPEKAEDGTTEDETEKRRRSRSRRRRRLRLRRQTRRLFPGTVNPIRLTRTRTITSPRRTRMIRTATAAARLR